jgi:hypothetical protein
MEFRFVDDRDAKRFKSWLEKELVSADEPVTLDIETSLLGEKVVRVTCGKVAANSLYKEFIEDEFGGLF